MDEKSEPNSDQHRIVDRGPHFYRKPDGSYIRPKFKREGLEKAAAAMRKIGDGTTPWYGLALIILEYVFGIGWVERCVLDSPEKGFLVRPIRSPEGTPILGHRVCHLAEMVLNLMPIRGVEACLDQLAGGQIESGYAELEAGKLLLTRDINFRFIWPSGVKGESFDLEIIFPNGIAVCADTKCKVETETFSNNGLRNTLESARKRNLPKGYPGAIIVKIPQAWYESAEIMARASVVCDEFLRGTKRIVCVELYSSMVALREGIIHDWLVGTEVRNNYHDYDPSLDWRLLINGNVAASNSPNGWWRLVDFFEIPK